MSQRMLIAVCFLSALFTMDEFKYHKKSFFSAKIPMALPQ